MENYYKILEIDSEASQETIDKVYKILVKKYHPDLQNSKDKIISEEKIKKINEAYTILSNPEKRQAYDNTIKFNQISIEEYNILLNENIELKNKLNEIQNKINFISKYYNSSTNKDNISYTYNRTPNSNYSSTQNYIPQKNNVYTKFRYIIKKIIKLFAMFLLLAIISYILLLISHNSFTIFTFLFIIIIYYLSK